MKPSRPTPAILPPKFLLTWQAGVLAFLLLIVPFFVTIPMVLRRNPIISPLGDQLHVPLLAGIALFIYWRGPFTGRLWPTVLAAAFVGGAIEFIQIPFGRNANFLDFVLDLVGIGIVVGFILWRGYGQKVGLGLIIALLLTFPARLYHVPFVATAAYHGQQIFPIIADLEGSRDHWLWGDNNALVTVVEIPDSPDGTGKVVRLQGSPPAQWPSAEMRRFPHDWSDYDELLFDVRLVASAADSQTFSVRCDDYLGRKENTWVSTGYVATTGWQTFRFSLAERRTTNGMKKTERLFDFADVDRILFYLPRPDSPAVLEIDNLRLR